MKPSPISASSGKAWNGSQPHARERELEKRSAWESLPLSHDRHGSQHLPSGLPPPAAYLEGVSESSGRHVKKQIPGPHLIRQVWDPNQEFAFPSNIPRCCGSWKCLGSCSPRGGAPSPGCARGRHGKAETTSKGCAGARTRESPRLGPKLTCGIAPRILGVSQI